MLRSKWPATAPMVKCFWFIGHSSFEGTYTEQFVSPYLFLGGPLVD
jgi:hypothetical protein